MNLKKIFLLLLPFLAVSLQAQTITICSQSNDYYNINGTGGNLAKQKLANPANFGPGGNICEFTYDFVTVGDGFTEITINNAGCDIWWSGYEYDGNYSTNEKQELLNWINNGGKVIAGCDGVGNDPVCELLGLVLNGANVSSGTSNITTRLAQCFPNVDVNTPIQNGGGEVTTFTPETAEGYLIVSTLETSSPVNTSLYGQPSALYAQNIFATTDVCMFVAELTNSADLLNANDYFMADAICALSQGSTGEYDCFEEVAAGPTEEVAEEVPALPLWAMLFLVGLISVFAMTKISKFKLNLG